MPARPPTVQRRPALIPRQPPRAVLNTFMALAVVVVERRIRKALRSGARDPGPARGD